MENLLMNEFISHYNLPAPTLSDWFEKTEEVYFETEDTNSGELALHTARGGGMAKFNNPNALNMTVINYDKFITAMRDEPFKHQRKRCDLLLTCNADLYFILGELKDRNPKGTVRSGAGKQLLASLVTLTDVPEIKSYTDSKTVRRCCYFNKQSSSPPVLNATTAFNRLSMTYPDGFKMSKPEIEILGFEFYEFTGEQTMVLAT